MFSDRRDAGRQLAATLRERGLTEPVIVGLPRGGVVVAAAVAEALEAPLDIVVVRKLGCPWQPELGVGAIAEDGVRVVNEALISRLGMTEAQLSAVSARETAELERRRHRYRGDEPPIDVAGRDVVVVDDGLATGYTARAAVKAMRRRGAARVTVAVPVAPEDEFDSFRSVADEVVAVVTWPLFFGVGDAYDDFRQVSDEEVVSILRSARPGTPADR